MKSLMRSASARLGVVLVNGGFGESEIWEHEQEPHDAILDEMNAGRFQGSMNPLESPSAIQFLFRYTPLSRSELDSARFNQWLP